MLIDIAIGYKDEFGEIDAEVLREARNIWHYGQKLALKILNDEQKGQILMMQASAKVSQKYREENNTINYLRSYLFQTFRRLVLEEARKQSRHRELEEKYFESLEELFQNDAASEEERICRQILIDEIVAKMDVWTKKVYRYRQLGYEFKDLVPTFGKAENLIRATYSRNLRRLAENIREK
jgi:DNA-directed RNA polymerase specialized sigma24 family protein